MKTTGNILFAVLAAAVLLAGCATEPIGTTRNRAMKLWREKQAQMKCQLAQNQMDYGKLDQARETLGEVLEADKDHQRARLMLAQVLLNQGKFAAAAARFRDVLKDEVKIADAHYLLATCYQRLKKNDLAEEHYALALGMEPDNPAYIIAHAESLVSCKRIGEACEKLSDRLDDFADSVPMLSAAAEIYSVAGNDRRAAQLASQVVEIEPDNSHAAEILAMSLYRMGQHAEAVPVLLRIAEKTDPEPLTGMLVMLAHCYTRLGDLEAAAKYLQQACRRKESPPEVRLQLAKVFAMMDEPDLALNAAQEALRREPANADGQAIRAMLLIEAGRPRIAAAHLRDAVRRCPRDTTLRVLLGRALAASGRKRAAIIEYRRVLSQDPDDPLADALLAELQPKPKTAPAIEREIEDDEEDAIGFED